MTALAWMDQALCTRLAGWDEASVPDKQETCGHCPVADTCLDYGMPQEMYADSGSERGWPVFGGMTREQRRSRRRRHGLRAVTL